METLNFVTVPIIIAIVYWAINLIKKETGGSEKILKNLPVIAALLGAVLGAVAFYAAPGLIPASDIFAAILTGGASGLAATGTNQIFKQAKKNKEDDDKPSE